MSGYRPSYLNVFLTFARNSLVRDMSFRTNFILQCISTISWTVMNIGFYLIVFQYTDSIGKGTGWGRDEFFVFLATTWIINILVQTFFMPNAQQFSELIRSGNLDLALLKPIDTQFVISFPRVDWAALSNLFMGIILLSYSLYQLTTRIESPLVLDWRAILMYPFYIACGNIIMYSVMITHASTTVWLGRNQTLYNFWFYITNFSRYPMEIYQVGWGIALWAFFTFLIPVLLVVNIPARIMARPLNTMTSQMWQLASFAVLATLLCFLFSRRVFVRALKSYRSASS
ncbi:MAG: ABC-2 family transporter protein [Pirellulales bacterium]|nr:ABC-2 family transporter protein [Pirellulales bacterium]